VRKSKSPSQATWPICWCWSPFP